MNAERLHAVARAVKDEIDAMSLAATLNRLRQGLEDQVNQPTDPNAQQAVSTARQELAAQLENAPSNTWSAADRQLVDELGIADILGARLLERVDSILSSNAITPSVARDEVVPLHDRMAQVDQNLSSLLSALAFFSIGAEELIDECEVTFTIPRSEVDDELRSLGGEFVELAMILGPFQELVLGTRPGIPVRSISSTDFGLFLAAARYGHSVWPRPSRSSSIRTRASLISDSSARNWLLPAYRTPRCKVSTITLTPS